MLSWITDHLTDLSGLLRQVGERDVPVVLPTGLGDEARHGGSPDHRDRPAGEKGWVKPRDLYAPERTTTGIRVQTRDFR